jgi:GT2 family glycosyltransferase
MSGVDDDDLITPFGRMFEATAEPEQEPEPDDDRADLDDPAFDERKYLRVNSDVAEAVRAGIYADGREHYRRHGRNEFRLLRLEYQHAWPLVESPKFPTYGVDAVFWSSSGRALVIGWIDDAAEPLASLSLILHETTLGLTDAIARCRRMDAEQAVGAANGRLLGFWTVFNCRTDVPPGDVRLVLMTHTERRVRPAAVQVVDDERLRVVAFEYLAHAAYWGNPQLEGFGQLDGGLGEVLIATNEVISAGYAARAFCRRFGPPRSRFTGSIVVCLYGRMEFMFLQAALFSTSRGWQDYEFIYVTNSPDLAEPMLKEAASITRIYGLNITLVILPGNAGFGAANNVAASYAQSDRILIVNPDVFPRTNDWAQRLTTLTEALPQEQTQLFGAPLFYDDGSLMHGGMYFELDEGLLISANGITRREMVRVEHYGKGAPPDTQQYLRSRAVPAVTGAFISVARDWFESLGGFAPDFAFGHYEDADLCLRSLMAGTPAWLHNVGFWHMEGKGSNRHGAHEGGSLVNRWHFTSTWADFIRSDLLGPHPKLLGNA